MKYRNIFLLTIGLLLSLAVHAQKLTVEGMTASSFDLSASQYERKDLAGQACGLVKVQLAEEGAKYEGNVFGNVEYKTGEYWVYMTQGAYMLRIKHPKFVPLDVNFRDYGISGVEGKVTYILTLLMGEKMQKLIIDYMPKDAMVLVDSKPYQRGGHLELTLPVGPHDYVIAKEGYTTIEGVAKLNKDNPRRIKEELQLEKGGETVQMPAKQQDSQESVSTQTLTNAEMKMIKKYAKEFLKEGWKVKPNLPSLDNQIARTMQVQMELDADGYDKWLTAEGRAAGINYDAARAVALTVAQGEISNKLRTDLTSQLEQYLANENFAQSDCEPIVNTVVTHMSDSIARIVNRSRTLLELYRELPNGNIEVLIRAAIPSETIDPLVEEGKTAMLTGALERQQSTAVSASSSPSSTSSSGATVETITVNGVSFNMIRVEGGTFMMGATSEQGSDAWDSEKPAHQVTLSTYSIGETEVAQELWQAVMGNNPSKFKGDNLPVEQVSWEDCQMFISKLNQLTGRRFRLPTEAEWEYAARGGSKSRGYKYSGNNNIDDVAWYTSNSSSKTHPVKTKQANELGLYDMSGNVWEWCQDWYGSYSSGSQTNPTGATSGSDRVRRGGGWFNGARSCRSAYRNGCAPSSRGYNLGMRLAL